MDKTIENQPKTTESTINEAKNVSNVDNAKTETIQNNEKSTADLIESSNVNQEIKEHRHSTASDQHWHDVIHEYNAKKKHPKLPEVTQKPKFAFFGCCTGRNKKKNKGNEPEQTLGESMVNKPLNQDETTK